MFKIKKMLFLLTLNNNNNLNCLSINKQSPKINQNIKKESSSILDYIIAIVLLVGIVYFGMSYLKLEALSSNFKKEYKLQDVFEYDHKEFENTELIDLSQSKLNSIITEDELKSICLKYNEHISKLEKQDTITFPEASIMGKYYGKLIELFKSIKINGNYTNKNFGSFYADKQSTKPDLQGAIRRRMFQEIKHGLEEINKVINFLSI